MSFTSISFLFGFLPIALLVYNIIREELREISLVVLSLIFYAIAAREFWILFVISIIVNVLCGRFIYILKKQIELKKILLFAGIIYNIGLLAHFKYFDCRISSFIGISFFTFKAISYLCDVYREKIVLNNSPIHDIFFLCFFAQIQSGPLSRYDNMKPRESVTREKKQEFNSFAEGTYRFIRGFCKKVLIADVLANIVNEVFSTANAELSFRLAWLGSICFSLQLFFDFAGYSDMAIGLTRMFGYECPENFEYPFMTQSVSEFWRKWHITLGAWFRDYIYIPMGGSRVNKRRVLLNLFVVWLLTGIWHGATANFIVWGLGYFVVIAFEKMSGYPHKLKSRIMKFIYRVGTILFINFQFVFFRSQSISEAIGYIKSMLVYSSNSLADTRCSFLLSEYGIFILAAIILCFPIVPFVKKKIVEKRVINEVCQTVYMICLCISFLWAISFVVAGANNPFMYANF